MNRKIIFQKCNFNYIYFLFYTIMYIVNIIIEKYIYPDEIYNDESEFANFAIPSEILFDLYIPNISDLIAIIPYFIRKRLIKKEENIITDEQSKDSELIYHNFEKAITSKKNNYNKLHFYRNFRLFEEIFFNFISYNIS